MMVINSRDPVESLVMYLFRNSNSSWEEMLRNRTRELLIEGYGDIATERGVIETKENEEIFSLEFKKRAFMLPRVDEILGHSSLNVMEALGAIKIGEFWMEIASSLTYLLNAGYLYSKLGRTKLSINVFDRAYIACEDIIDGAEGVLKGILMQVMAICALMTGKPGVHDLFCQSYKSLEEVDKELRDRDGVESFLEADVGGYLIDKIAELFIQKMQLNPERYSSVIGSDLPIISLGLSRFYVELTQGL